MIRDSTHLCLGCLIGSIFAVVIPVAPFAGHLHIAINISGDAFAAGTANGDEGVIVAGAGLGQDGDHLVRVVLRISAHPLDAVAILTTMFFKQHYRMTSQLSQHQPLSL